MRARVRAAREALAGAPFQVAVLDVGLPDGNGFEVAQALRDRSPATAMLFLTAYGTPEDRIRGLELGADDYVTKPFVFRELLLRIQNMQKRAQRPAAAGSESRRPGAHRHRRRGLRPLHRPRAATRCSASPTRNARC